MADLFDVGSNCEIEIVSSKRSKDSVSRIGDWFELDREERQSWDSPGGRTFVASRIRLQCGQKNVR